MSSGADPRQAKVGILAIQGDYEKHRAMFVACGLADEEVAYVKTPEQLARVDRLVIPGGESTTVGLLMERFGMIEAVRGRVSSGMPIWGTCMGMILMARGIEGPKTLGGSEQPTLGVMDIVVRRNAFGAQIHSFESLVAIEGIGDVMGVFIRAPIVTEWGSDVEVLARLDDQVVAVRQGRLLGTSFHPELTGDLRLHELFLKIDCGPI